jgi:hypothetical protein
MVARRAWRSFDGSSVAWGAAAEGGETFFSSCMSCGFDVVVSMIVVESEVRVRLRVVGTVHSKATVRTRGSGFRFYRVVRRMNEHDHRQCAERCVRRSASLRFPSSGTVLGLRLSPVEELSNYSRSVLVSFPSLIWIGPIVSRPMSPKPLLVSPPDSESPLPSSSFSSLLFHGSTASERHQ